MTSSPLSGATSMPSMRPFLTRRVRASRPPGTTTCAFTNVNARLQNKRHPFYGRSTAVLRSFCVRSTGGRAHDQDRPLSVDQLGLAPILDGESRRHAGLSMSIEGVPEAVNGPLTAVALERARPARRLAGGMHHRIDDAPAGAKHARDLGQRELELRDVARGQDRTPPDRSSSRRTAAPEYPRAQCVSSFRQPARASPTRGPCRSLALRDRQARAGSGRYRNRRRARSARARRAAAPTRWRARAPSAGYAAAVDTISPTVRRPTADRDAQRLRAALRAATSLENAERCDA